MDALGTPDIAPLPPIAYAPLAPAPASAHRVWTVFAAFAIALASTLAFTALVLLALAAREAQLVDGSFTRVTREGFEFALRSPVGLLGSGLAACLSFALCALVPASLSPDLFEARLRLAHRPRWGAWGVVVAVGMLGVGQVGSTLLSLAGLAGRGALGEIHRALWRPSPGLALAAFAIVCVGAGVGEELFFRGYAQTRFAQRWGAWPSVLASAALFALVHGDPLHGAFAFAAGVLLGWASLRTGTIRTTLVAHVANNTASLAGMALTDPAHRDSPRAAAMSLAAGAAMIALSVLALRRAKPYAA
jgi:membrane protease YdiL (CAAX protease family)